VFWSLGPASCRKTGLPSSLQDWLLHQAVRVGIELREIRARSWRERVGYILVKAGHFADRLRVIAGKTPKHSSVDEQKLRGVLSLSPRQRRISGFAGRHGRISPKDVLWQSNLFSCSHPQSALAGSTSGMEGCLS
jgi:hypothetical protein